MGVPNFSHYICTEHAKERFIERIDPQVNVRKLNNKVWGLLANATFLETRGENRQLWLNAEHGIVFVLDQTIRKVITCYKSDSRNCDPLELAFRQVSPELQEVLINSARKFRNLTIRQSSAKLEELYLRAAHLHKVLGHTKRGDVIQKYYQELIEVQEEINKIEQRRNEFLSDIVAVV